MTIKERVIIDDDSLSIRCRMCLRSAGIETLGDLIQHKRTDLLKFRNFGKRSLHELDDLLARNGLEWKVMKTMQDYTNYCTDMQIIRARKLGAPIYVDENGKIKLPTTQQMIGWLREQGFWIYVKLYRQYNTFYACIEKQGLTKMKCTDDFEKPEQAEHAAIDIVFDSLEKGGQL